MLRLCGVEFEYWAGCPVLRRVDLQIAAGLTLLVGPNGSGKSSLLKILAGVERPDAGIVEIDGLDLWRHEVEARQRLAYVPEVPDLSPYATVREILEFAGRLRGSGSRAVAQALAMVGLENLGGRSVREPSQGQRRRAVVAAALVATPPNLLLDEPLEAFDREGRQRLLTWIGQRRHFGAVAVVSHELEPFLPLIDAVVAVREGCCRCVVAPKTGAERNDAIEALARGVW